MATERSVAGESGDQDFVNIDNVDAFPTKDGSSSPAPQEPGIILSVGQQGGSRRKHLCNMMSHLLPLRKIIFFQMVEKIALAR